MSDALAKAVKKLYKWQYGFRDETDFTIHLFSSFQRANEEEFKKLAESFPTEAKAYRLWNTASDPVEFFKAYSAWDGPRK